MMFVTDTLDDVDIETKHQEDHESDQNESIQSVALKRSLRSTSTGSRLQQETMELIIKRQIQMSLKNVHCAHGYIIFLNHFL